MNVKEKIYNEIGGMALNELALLYEQIRLIKKIHGVRKTAKSPLTIEELHKYTSSSKTTWSKDISNSRDDRF